MLKRLIYNMLAVKVVTLWVLSQRVYRTSILSVRVLQFHYYISVRFPEVFLYFLLRTVLVQRTECSVA